MATSRNTTCLRRWAFVKGKEPTFDALKENFEEMLKALNLPDVHMRADEEKLVFRGMGPYMPVAVWLEMVDGKPVVEMAVSGKGEQIRAQDLEKYFVRSIGAVDRFLASMDRAELFRQKYLTKGAAFGVGAVAGAAMSKAVVGSVKLVAKGVRALLRDQEAYDKELAFYLRAMGIGDLVVGGKDSGNLTPVLKEQAEQENVLAQYQLGVSYASGVGVAADEDEAIRWFERAASHGELRSKNIVAGAWLYGDKDYPVEKKLLGVQYLVDLAASGETWAPAQIIDIYKDGAVSGIPADYDKMVEYAAMYAQQGYLYAAHVLAEVCDTTRGPEVSRPYKDDAQAALLYNMILENEKCDYTETAAMCLADMYRTGRGVAENVEQAIACYRQASSYGNMEAKLALLELFSQTLENEESRTEIRTLARQLKGSGSAPLNAAAVYFLYRVEDAEEQYGKAMKLAQQYVADPCAETQKSEETKAYLAKMEERISQMSEEERRTFLKEGKRFSDGPAWVKGVIVGIVALIPIVIALCVGRTNYNQKENRKTETIEAWEMMDDPYAVDVYGEMILVRDTNDDCVNLREGPGTEYDVITELPNGTWVNLATGMQDDRWTCLILSDGRLGWVYSDFVHDLRGVIRNNSNTGCNVRQGPGTDYDIIGYLYNGEYATAYDACDDDGWYCIEYEGGVGWISGGFWHDGGLYVYNTNYDGANFRAEPSEESEILAYITNYETVIPVDGVDEGEWVHVQYAGMTGWVYRDFICYSGRRENDTEVVQASSQLTSSGSRSDANLTDYEVEYIQTILASLGRGNDGVDVSATSDMDIVCYTSNLVEISYDWDGTINIIDWEAFFDDDRLGPIYSIEREDFINVARQVFGRDIEDEDYTEVSNTYAGYYGVKDGCYCRSVRNGRGGYWGIELLDAQKDEQYTYVDYRTYWIDMIYEEAPEPTVRREPTDIETMSAVLSRNDDEKFPFRLVSACAAGVSNEEPDEYLGEEVSVFDEVYWHFSVAGVDDEYDATYTVCLHDDGTYTGFALLGSGPNVGDIMGGNLIAGQYYFDGGSLYIQDVECQYLQDENVFFAGWQDCYWVWQPDVDGTYRAEFEQYEQAREAFLD